MAPGMRWRARRVFRLACVMGLLLWPVLGAGQPGHDMKAAAKDVAGQFAQHFPHLQGEVVRIQEEKLYLSLGARDRLSKNMRLQVFREGEELTSPSTGEVLGRVEEDLGSVIITQVAETYSVAVRTDAAGRTPVQSGDRVRITAGRLPLALLQVSGPAAPATALLDAVQDSLEATGRFFLVPRGRLTLWLLERNLSPGDMLSPEVMSEAAASLGVEYFVQPVLRDNGDTVIVEFHLLVPAQPQSPVTTALAVIADVEAAAQGSVGQPGAPVPAPRARPESLQNAADVTLPGETEGLTVLHSLLSADPLSLENRYLPIAQFATELRGFDAADIDGDGRTEVVIADDTQVSLYLVKESQLVLVASYSDRRPGTVLSAQLLLLPETGLPAVVVNRYSSTLGRMDSLLLALQDNRLIRQQKSLSDILLAVDVDGDGLNDSIWGQRFDGVEFFRRGQVRRYELQNGRLKRQGKLSLPVRFRATGCALAQLAPNGRQLVFIDERNSLQVYEDHTRRWTSPEDVGGSYVFATLNDIRGAGTFEQEQFDFEAIPAVADLDGDGLDEVLIPRNQSRLGVVPNLNLFSVGHVLLMRRTPQGFALSPVSPRFDGVVSGVAILKGGEAGILVAVSKREGMLRRKKQTTIYFMRL